MPKSEKVSGFLVLRYAMGWEQPAFFDDEQKAGQYAEEFVGAPAGSVEENHVAYVVPVTRYGGEKKGIHYIDERR